MRQIIGMFLITSSVAFILSLICLIFITTRNYSPSPPPPTQEISLFSANSHLLVNHMQNGSIVLDLNMTNSCPATQNETLIAMMNYSFISLSSDIQIHQLENGTVTFMQNSNVSSACSCVNITNNFTHITGSEGILVNSLPNGTFVLTLNLTNATCDTVVCESTNSAIATNYTFTSGGGDNLLIDQFENGTIVFTLNVSSACSCVNVTNNFTHFQNVSLVGSEGIIVNQLSNGTVILSLNLTNATCDTVVCASSNGVTNATNYTFTSGGGGEDLLINQFPNGTVIFTLNNTCTNTTNNYIQNVSLIGGTGIHVEQLPNGTFQINSTDTWFNASMPSEVFAMESQTVNNKETMRMDLKDQQANTVFAGPQDAKKRAMDTPTFRHLTLADLPVISQGYIWLGNTIVPLAAVSNFGLILTNVTFSTTGTLQYLQQSTPASGTFLAGNGTGSAFRTLQTSDLPNMVGANGINVTVLGPTSISINASQCENPETTMPDGTTTFVNVFTSSTAACSKVRLSNINHDQLRNYVAGQHVDHSAVSITAGFGLLGGGTIAASRTLSFDLNVLPQPNMTNATGLLPVARGGTNSAATLNNNCIMISSSGAIVEASALTNGQLLGGSTGAAPVAASITAGNAMQVTNAAGSITVAYSHKENVAATTAPTVSDSTSNGYSVGSVWINTVTKVPYICTDATAGAAVWKNMLLPYSDLVQADDTIACSTSSYVLASGMTLTPPAGTYMVTFAVGGLTHATLDASISIRIYTDGVVSSATMLWWRGGLAAAVAGTATAIAKVTVNGSQAIEGRWSSSTSTANMRGRVLSVVQTA